MSLTGVENFPLLNPIERSKNQNFGYHTYVSNFTYNAAGAVTSLQLGNGKWESTVFNSRLQPTQIALGTVQNGTDKLKLNYSYGDWNGGSIDGTKNNGNVVQQIVTVPTVGASTGFTATQKYYYDSLNRIDDATEDISGQTWRQDFTYDRYGNRNFQEANTTTLPKNCGTSPNFTVCTTDVPIVNPSAIATTNKLTGYTYDSSGNTTQDAELRKFTYDGENKQVQVETVNSGGTVTGTVGEYVYDGDGKRVKKKGYTNNVLTEETIFVYDAAGKLVAEYSSDIASVNDAKVAYLTNDHLGSPRVNTDQNGTVTARHDYHPFGEEIATSHRIGSLGYTDDTVRKQFTGYERDNESDLDFAEARYYNSAHGRFTTTDPVYMTDERLVDPQRLNTYVYVRNDPLKYADPSGLDIEVKGQERDWAIEKIKEGVSFAKVIGVNGQGKLAISDGKGGFLDPNKKEDNALLGAMANALKDDKDVDLFKAIVDPNTHAVLEANTTDNTADIGSSAGPGYNKVDRKETEMTETAGSGRKGSLTAAEIVKHEAMEAYGTAKTGKSLGDDPSPHKNNPYSGIFLETKKDDGRTQGTFLSITNRPGGTYTITKKYDGGVSKDNTLTGNITRVTFKPDKK